jgi:hypothetical protein
MVKGSSSSSTWAGDGGGWVEVEEDGDGWRWRRMGRVLVWKDFSLGFWPGYLERGFSGVECLKINNLSF